MRGAIFWLCSLALALGGCAYQSHTPGPTANSSSSRAGDMPRSGLSAKDARFVAEATQSALLQVQLGQLASQIAQAQELRDFGRRLVEQYSRNQQELAGLAIQKGTVVSIGLEPAQEQRLQRLARSSGEDFDRSFRKETVRAQQRLLKQLRKGAEGCQDRQLKDFAQRNLPLVKDYLSSARQLTALNAAGATSGPH